MYDTQEPLDSGCHGRVESHVCLKPQAIPLMLCCVHKLTDGAYCRQCTSLVFISQPQTVAYGVYICTVHHRCWKLSVCSTFVVIDNSADPSLFSHFFSFSLLSSPSSLPPSLPPQQVSVCAMEILCLLIRRLKDKFKPHLPTSKSAKESSIWNICNDLHFH